MSSRKPPPAGKAGAGPKTTSSAAVSKVRGKQEQEERVSAGRRSGPHSAQDRSSAQLFQPAYTVEEEEHNDDEDDENDDDDDDDDNDEAAQGKACTPRREMAEAAADGEEDEEAPRARPRPPESMLARYQAVHGRGIGPFTWQEVDEGRLSADAQDLADSLNRAFQGNRGASLLDRLFESENAEAKLLQDPLGTGPLGKLVKDEEGTGTILVQSRSRGSSRRRDNGGGMDSALDPELLAALPNQEQFSPEVFLGTFHKDAKEQALRKGLKALGAELSERTGQLKQLISENFDRFTSCQATIDDIRAKLQQVQKAAAPVPQPPAVGKGGKKGDAGGGKKGGAGKGGAAGAMEPVPSGPAGIEQGIQGVQGAARATWGAVLERDARAQRIRGVAALLTRFHDLFGMPGHIKALAARGDLSAIVSEYRRANQLIKPSAASARVWVGLYQEVEKRVLEAYAARKAALLRDAPPDRDRAPDTIVFMARLAQEKLPGSRGEDAMVLFLRTSHQQLEGALAACDAKLSAQLQAVRAQLEHLPAMRAAALDFAAAWKLQGPRAWQLDVAQSLQDAQDIAGAADAAKAGLYTSRSRRQTAASRRMLSRRRTAKSRATNADVGDDDEEETDMEDWDGESGEDEDVSMVSTDADGESSSSDGDATKGAKRVLGAASGPARAERSASAAGKPQGAGAQVPPSGSQSGAAAALGAPPAPPASVEDLAALMWPGPGDWRPEEGLPPALVADLQWRLAPGTPRSALLPEPSFRLSPAQSAWSAYVAQLATALLARAPGMWAVANSGKYAHVSDAPPAVRESMLGAPAAAKKAVEAIMSQFSARVQAALQALSQAGPLCPAVELVVKELCRAWLALRAAGAPAPALDGVRDAAFSALALYAACLVNHLAAVPQMVLWAVHSAAQLFDGETWSLDLGQAERQPVTQLPARLQEEVCLVMFHFGVLAACCEAVDEARAAAAWAPLREALLGCLAAFTACLDAQAAALQSRAAAAAAQQAATGPRPLSRSTTTTPSSRAQGQEAEGGGEGRGPAGAAAALLHLAPAPSSMLDELAAATDLQALLVQPTARATEGAAPDPSPVFVPGRLPGGSGRVAPPGLPEPATELSRADEARLLVTVSNAVAVRREVIPAVVELYRPRLEGAQGGSGRRLKEVLGLRVKDMAAATTRLLAAFMRHKAAQATRAAQAYIRLVCAGDGDSSASGGAPLGISDACQALLGFLASTHTLVSLYSPRSVGQAVLPGLVGHLCQELARLLPSALNDAGPHALLQLFADVAAMQRVWEKVMDDEAGQQLQETAALLRLALRKGLGAAGDAVSSPELAALATAAAAGTKTLAKALDAWAAPLVEQGWVRSQCNLACFVHGVHDGEGVDGEGAPTGGP